MDSTKGFQAPGRGSFPRVLHLGVERKCIGKKRHSSVRKKIIEHRMPPQLSGVCRQNGNPPGNFSYLPRREGGEKITVAGSRGAPPAPPFLFVLYEKLITLMLSYANI